MLKIDSVFASQTLSNYKKRLCYEPEDKNVKTSKP